MSQYKSVKCLNYISLSVEGVKNESAKRNIDDENTNTYSNASETRPFSYGVVWIIKL